MQLSSSAMSAFAIVRCARVAAAELSGLACSARGEGNAGGRLDAFKRRLQLRNLGFVLAADVPKLSRKLPYRLRQDLLPSRSAPRIQ